jgi:hypothetical protein
MMIAPAAIAQTAPPPAPAAKPIANPQPDHPAYGDLIDAIESTVNRGQLLDNGSAAIKRQMQGNAALAAAEAASPGLLDEIVTNMRPILESQNVRVSALYRPKMVAAMADYLTPPEAASVAAFYRSDLGRRLMGSVVANYSFDTTLTAAISEKPVTAADVNTDINNAVAQGMANMDAKDVAEMGKQALANPALIKLQQVNPEIQRLRAAMENEPLTPEEDAAIIAVVEGAFARRFPQ